MDERLLAYEQRGTHAVLEATVSVRILDSAGHEIARTFTNATCGTGCRGGYSVTVPYSVPRTQPGTIVVFESSARGRAAGSTSSRSR